MHITQISGAEDKYFDEFLRIYASSFPTYEQRTAEQHLYAFENSAYTVNGYTKDGSLIGFIAYWDFTDHIYIEHLAIHPAFRGMNHGSNLLSQFIEQHTQIIILEIDSVVDDISIKRYNFYKQLGFIKNEHTHIHPAYRKGFEDHPLVVMSTQRALSNEEYKQFYANLKSVVMNKASQ